MKILGLDPGLRYTGWGIVEYKGNRISHIANGVIATDNALEMSKRLLQIHLGIKSVIESYSPDQAAVEETFVNVNPKSTLKLGEARGVVLLTPSCFGVPVFEYATNKIKKAIVGVGHADKKQVITMIGHLLPGCGRLTSDAADALAVAICHGNHL